MKQNNGKFWAALALLGAFVLWTAAVCLVDVQSIGPQETAVGFATVNGAFHNLTGVHLWLYTVTDWLSLIPLGAVAGFGLLGLCQWIRRKKLRAVDRNILALGVFYLAVAAVFILFEVVVINYRPVMLEGVLEASYPSSTTMLVLCVMPTAAVELKRRLRCRWIAPAITAFTLFMVAGRLISGVHWLTDIIGGVLISGSLVLFYQAVREMEKQ